MRRINVSACQDCEPVLILAKPLAGKGWQSVRVVASINRPGDRV